VKILIFGAGSTRFSQKIEESMTEQQIDDFIAATKIESKVEELKINKKISEQKAKYIAIASFIREAFFNKYKGLMARLNVEHENAITKHYVRTMYGPVRHLPAFKYASLSTHTNNNSEKVYAIKGFDKEQYSAYFSGLLNDAGNSPIQTYEAVLATFAILTIDYYLRLWKFESLIWNFVHDSVDLYVTDEEEELVAALCNTACSKYREYFHSIPMSIDLEISDVSTLYDDSIDENNKEFYQNGKSIKALPINEALENYNKKHNTQLYYKDIDELNFDWYNY
jgi:hypothetical protein